MPIAISARQAMRFVREHGIVLAAARGPVPRLTEFIAGEPIRGSWWAHPHSHHIHAILETIGQSHDILTCRLIDRKVTLVHRRLWPALVRAAARFTAGQLAQVRQEHTTSGHHVNREVAFPLWVPRAVYAQAQRLSEQQACSALAPWAAPQAARGPARRVKRGRTS